MATIMLLSDISIKQALPQDHNEHFKNDQLRPLQSALWFQCEDI